MILAAVVLGSTLYATTLLVASTLLPQMQGSFAATPDEIAWTTTFNILATAIVTPMTGFLVARFNPGAVAAKNRCTRRASRLRAPLRIARNFRQRPCDRRVNQPGGR